MAAPTATDDALGADAWQLGAAAIYFSADSAQVQYGRLLTYQTDVSGDDDVGLLVAQPFGFVQVGNGTYSRTSPLWIFDLESSEYSVPIGLGVGKIVVVGKTVLNFFVEPQISVLHEGAGWPELQVLAALNMQFR